MSIFAKALQAINFTTIKNGQVPDKTHAVNIMLHLNAGTTYQFQLSGNKGGLREGLYEGNPNSTHRPASGQNSRITFDGKPVILSNTPLRSGDYYISISNPNGLSNFTVGEAIVGYSGRKAISSQATQLAAAIGDTSHHTIASAFHGIKQNDASEISSMVVPTALKHDG